MKHLLLATLLCLGLAGQQNTVFRRNVFQGITTTQASAPLPNIGQAVHIVTLIYPSAVADVTGFVFRVEASFDNTTYFPISEDITTATYNGSYAYVVNRCNGVYPYVRFRLVTAAAAALTAHYTGSLQPIGLVKLSGTRYIADSPLAGPVVAPPGVTFSGIYYVRGRRMTPITASDWTSVNFEAAKTTRYDDANSLSLLDPFNAAQEWRMVCRSVPAAPYTVRVHFQQETSVVEGAATNKTGVILRESGTGKFVVWAFGFNFGNAFYHEKWNSVTSFNSTYTNQNWRMTGGDQMISLELTDNNTTRSYLIWNGFRSLSPLQPNSAFWGTGVPRTDFITPDQLCFGLRHDNGNYPNYATLLGYDLNPTW